MYKVRPIYDDIRLFFDEPSHKYTDNLGNEYVSTTTLLHNYKPKFDKEYWLNKKAKELHISKERLAKHPNPRRTNTDPASRFCSAPPIVRN